MIEQRSAYNDMVMEMAGQPPRRRNPNHKIENKCTPRIEEIARPRDVHKPLVKDGGVTGHTDYRGLVHVSHKHALEAQFPGQGHKMCNELADQMTTHARPGWPPPELPGEASPRSKSSARTGARGTVSHELSLSGTS